MRNDLQPTSLPPHVASIIKYSTLTGVVLFLAVATYVRWLDPSFGIPGGLEPLTWTAIAIAAAGFLGARAVAGLPAASDAQRGRTRMFVQLALCEAGGLLGGFAWLLTGDVKAWIAAGISVFGMAIVRRPSDAAEPNASRRMMR